jgi:tRNA pseudouridine38-40 synthase
MQSFKITLAYDGTDFVGWQRQASGASIQGILEDILHKLDVREVAVIGAGRTDAGVHALGQVASFSIDRAIAAGVLVRLLNAQLPGDIRVLSAQEVAPAFHARFDATWKKYRYRIWNEDVISPFERRYAWHVAGGLDVEAMAAGARLLEGRHDFSAFQAAGSSVCTTERFVSSSRVVSEGPGPLLYEISGDGFLRHMVRNIVGTLVEVGRRRRSVEWMAEVLAARCRAQAGPTAPARGLFLAQVEYGHLSRAEACGRALRACTIRVSPLKNVKPVKNVKK